MCTFRVSCYTPHYDAILYYDKYLVVNKGTYLSCRIFYCIYTQIARAHLYISNFLGEWYALPDLDPRVLSVIRDELKIPYEEPMILQQNQMKFIIFNF